MVGQVTTAILFNRQRGSGREVAVNLVDAGVEIVSLSGEPIAVWTYDVIDLIKETNLPDEGSFTVPHDPFHTLQAVPADTFDAIIERAAPARRTLRGSVWNFERLWQGVPGNLRGVIVVAIGYGVFKAYEWIF